MIRSTLHQLAISNTPFLQLGIAVAKPAAAVLAGKLRYFSTSPRHDEEIVDKNFSSEFDESDSLEVGKTERPARLQRRSGRRPDFFARSIFDDPFFRRSGFDDLFRDPFAPFFSRREDPFLDIMPVLRANLDPRKTLLRSSPGYEIKELDKSFEIEVRIPEGLKAKDLKIEVEDNVLHLSGMREDEHRVTRFEKLFTVGANVDLEKMTATFQDGVLSLEAPKLEVLPEKRKSIKITEGTRSPEDIVNATYSDEFDESDWAEKGKANKEKNQ
jgi:HSP20 family protein